MTQPRITVITPCRNQERFVEQALCSVLDQGYANLEYIVIDAGSDDQSGRVIDLYRSRLTQCIHQSDHGPAEALNMALAHATGDIVGILYADDLYLPGTLDMVARRMKTADNPWTVGRCLRIGENDQMLGIYEPPAEVDLRAYLMHNCEPLPTVASFYRREVFQAHGYFDESLQYAFDYEFVCRLLGAGISPGHLPHLTSAMREHTQSRSALHPVDMGLEFISAARRHAEHLPTLPERISLWRNCDQRERIFELARAEMQGDEGRGYLWQRLLHRPWWLANGSLRQMLVRGGRMSFSVETLNPLTRKAA